MPAVQYPHALPVEWEDVIFDRSSVGSTRRSEGDAALWVAMRPSVFLSIATPLPCPRPSLDWLRTRIDTGQAICPAELVFDAHLSVPHALSHEGRHRMTALREGLRDRPVPVRLRLNGMQDSDLDHRLIGRLRQEQDRSVAVPSLRDRCSRMRKSIWAADPQAESHPRIVGCRRLA